jgi:hypothetical protein
LHTKNQLYTLPRSALKVCVVVVGGWVVLKANLVISFGFGQAEQLLHYYFRYYCFSLQPSTYSTVTVVKSGLVEMAQQ